MSLPHCSGSERPQARILLVDDQRIALHSLQRILRPKYQVDTATEAESALALIAATPYAVVVSDLHMPGMDGIRFLRRVRESRPEIVRLMLSGSTDMDAALEAVNEGNVFQFLTKPCSEQRLRRALDAAVHQHELLTAESELLERTLGGSIALMTEILAAVNPAAFGATSRIRAVVGDMARQLRLASPWEIDLAAMFSTAGFVALPARIHEKIQGGVILSLEETVAAQEGCVEPHAILTRIPRLGNVGEIVRLKGVPYCELRDPQIPETVALGAQMIHIAATLDRALHAGQSWTTAVTAMRQEVETYNPELVALLDSPRIRVEAPAVLEMA